MDRGPAALLIASRVFLDDGTLVLLPEVKRLSRVDLISDTCDEVLVRDLTITIFVEEFEDDILLLGLQWEAPMLQEKDELVFVDIRIVVLIKVFESLATG